MKIHWAVAAVAAAVAISACGARTERAASRSMEQIHAEDGVPVRARIVEPRPFATALLYNAVLRGVAETKVTALVSDHVAGVQVRVGDFVEKDAVLVTFPTDNPALGYEQARVAFQTAEETLGRLTRLFQQNGVSKQDYDNARAGYEVARANWTSIQDKVRVRAPISGYVARLAIRPTDYVRSGDELLTISNYDRLEARVWVADTEIRELRVGLPATARWQGEEVTGRVAQVDLAMNVERQAFLAVVRFDNAERRLSSGVTAEVRIQTYFSPQAISVQRKEIVSDATGPAAYVLEAGRAVRRPLTLGREQGSEVEVLAGLRPGELQIVESLNLLSDGAAVRVIAE